MTITILEDLNFQWEEKEMLMVERWWNDGRDMFDMAKRLNRDPDEIECLIKHLARKDKIVSRPGGIKGNKKEVC